MGTVIDDRVKAAESDPTAISMPKISPASRLRFPNLNRAGGFVLLPITRGEPDETRDRLS